MKTILITGASSGIGRACAEKLADPDILLVLCSRDIVKLRDLKGELEKKCRDILIYEVDVRQSCLVDCMFDDLDKRGIKIDVLVNNAGLALGLADIKDGHIADWDVMIDTNIKGLLYILKRAVNQMVESDFGHIINIGSIAGVHSYAKGAVYAATKSAVKFISDGLRKELVKNNIKVTNIQPGLVETNFSKIRFHGDQEKAGEVYKGINPLMAEDIADIILYVVTRPQHVQICEITVTPTHQASVDVIHRN